VAVTVPLPEKFVFPSVCPCCLAEIGGNEKKALDEVRFDESAFGFFTEALSGMRVTPVFVPYCVPCSRHVNMFRTPKSWGCLGLLLVISAFMIGAKAGLFAGLAVVVTPIVLWFAVARPRRLKNAETLRGHSCCAAGPVVKLSGTRTFEFENEGYGVAFMQANGLAPRSTESGL